jgi:hypothetical protein
MGHYRKKPVVIEAVRYTGANIAEIWDAFTAEHVYGPVDGVDGHPAYVETGGGRVVVNPGDWVIRGTAGELYPCRPEIFEETYEAVE